MSTKEMMVEHVVAAELVLAEELTQSRIEIEQETFEPIRFPNFLMDFRSSDANNPGKPVGRQVLDDRVDSPTRKVKLGLLFGLVSSRKKARWASKLELWQFFRDHVTGMNQFKFSGRWKFGAGVAEVERVDVIAADDVVERRQHRDILFGSVFPLL